MYESRSAFAFRVVVYVVLMAAVGVVLLFLRKNEKAILQKM